MEAIRVPTANTIYINNLNRTRRPVLAQQAGRPQNEAFLSPDGDNRPGSRMQLFESDCFPACH
jgi:hypothetical protein